MTLIATQTGITAAINGGGGDIAGTDGRGSGGTTGGGDITTGGTGITGQRGGRRWAPIRLILHRNNSEKLEGGRLQNRPPLLTIGAVNRARPRVHSRTLMRLTSTTSSFP